MTATETKTDLGYLPPFDAKTAPPVEKPQDHGFNTGPVFMPRQLRNLDWDTSKTPAEMEARYDKWRIRILRPCSLGYGRNAVPGQTCEISGAIAAQLVAVGQATWDNDPKIEAEMRQIEEAKRLGINPRDLNKLEKINPSKQSSRPRSEFSGWLTAGKP